MIILNHRENTSTLGIPEESAGLKLPVSRNGVPDLAVCRDDAEEFGDFGHLIVA